MKSVICLFFSAVSLFALSLGVAAQTAGSLDTSFGSGGIVTSQLNGLLAWSSDMTIQPDNKLIVASRGFKIARLNQNGTLDTTFDADGIADISPCQPETVQLSMDGKIVFGGYYSVSNTTHICNGRLNSNGTLDTTFDTDGIVQTTMGIESHISSINILPDGKILAAGWTSLQDFGNRDYAMVRYNANGSLDTTFGTGGRVAAELGSNEFLYDSEIQSDGKIILVGDYTDNLSSQTMAAIVRFNSNGTLDTSFGNNGKVFRLAAQNGEADEVNIQPDGKIIISGNGLVPARYTANGTLDTEFNAPAWITTSASAIQPDGKILVLGATMAGSQFLLRYNNNGTVDSSFGVGGIVMNTGQLSQPAFKILIAPDRKIVLMGTRTSAGNGFFEIVLLRYLNNRPPFMDFDGDSRTDISIFRPSNGQWWFSRSSDNSNYALTFGLSTDKIVPADYTGDGKTDVAVYRPSAGEWYVLRSEDFTYYAFPFGVSTDTPVSGDFDGDGRADTAVYRASTRIWYILKSTGGLQITAFGIAGDKPVPADFDGDGKNRYCNISQPVRMVDFAKFDGNSLRSKSYCQRFCSSR